MMFYRVWSQKAEIRYWGKGRKKYMKNLYLVNKERRDLSRYSKTKRARRQKKDTLKEKKKNIQEKGAGLG